MINVFYRISDNGNKSKIPGLTKPMCFENFLTVFAGHPITVIADKCQLSTLKWLREKSSCWESNGNIPKIIETSIGNAPEAMRQTIDVSLLLPDTCVVYFVEDDYIHLPTPLQLKTTCPTLIQEGLKTFNYVTLYDHPDKYESEYSFGEVCKVYKTPLSHWRQTISTTLTFATTIKNIKEDFTIWKTAQWDHLIFSAIAQKSKTLGVCIPGAACHMDVTYSNAKQKNLLEPWAMDFIEKQLIDLINKNNNEEALEYYQYIAHLELNTKKLAMLSVLANKV